MPKSRRLELQGLTSETKKIQTEAKLKDSSRFKVVSGCIQVSQEESDKFKTSIAQQAQSNRSLPLSSC